MGQAEHIDDISEELSRLELVPINKNSTYESLLKALTVRITELINYNFQFLVQLLYQIDIPENKLRALLEQANDTSAAIIAQAIIERQLQKIETRKAFKKDDNIPEDEKW